MRLRPAIFLDRDGTLNEDPGYLRDPRQLKLFPHVGDALSLLQHAGYVLIVVSNQSGVGRGLIQKKELDAIHAQLDQLLQYWSVRIQTYQLCLHRPEESCPCRKPRPQLLLDAAACHQLDLSQSYMVGDKASDLEAGWAAGCKGSLLVRTGEGRKTESGLTRGQASFVGDSLLEVVHWMISQHSSQKDTLPHPFRKSPNS